jgi:chitinase
MVWSRLFSALAVAAAVTFVGGTVSSASASGSHARPLPEHVFAPYFEAYTSDSPASLSNASGARFLTFAFLQTPAPGSCEIAWNGTAPVAASRYGSDIAAIRASGGDVVPSFGGYSADHGGTEIADSCTDVASIAAAYEKVITTYDVTRLDMDVEDNSQTNAAGVDRRNKAIAMVERWARSHHRTVQFVYTIPTNVHGLDPAGVQLLQNAVSNHARIDIVNIMTFDYYDNQPHEMAADTQTAANALVATLQQVYPGRSSRDLWSMVGITEMIGIDDFGPAETFTLRDAGTVLRWADAKGIAELSFWALQRDKPCPGIGGSDSCSGLAQSPWQFSHIFEPFTERG